MKYKTFEMEINGYKIGFSDNPEHTRSLDDLWEKNLWECYLVQGDYYATTIISKDALKNEEFKHHIPKILLKEIEKMSHL